MSWPPPDENCVYCHGTSDVRKRGFSVMSVTGIMLIFKPAFQLSTNCVTSTVHNLVGFFLVAGVLAHVYLGTVANPGTWRVLVDGSVTREWARHHHPNWYRALIRSGRIEPDDQDEPEEAEPDRPDEETRA